MEELNESQKIISAIELKYREEGELATEKLFDYLGGKKYFNRAVSKLTENERSLMLLRVKVLALAILPYGKTLDGVNGIKSDFIKENLGALKLELRSLAQVGRILPKIKFTNSGPVLT